MSDDDFYMAPPPISAGLRGRCPRCGQGRMFVSYIELVPSCSVCNLDYAFADSGDGPAVFVTLIGGFLVLGFALWLEFTFDPPFWIHLLFSVPILLIVCGGLLRLLKGVLIALQYRNKAAEGRLDQG